MIHVFIASSAESLSIVKKVEGLLPPGYSAHPWTESGNFLPGNATVSSLEEIAERMDCGLFVCAPNDFLTIRGKRGRTMRDNVLFELGLFFGRMGKDRSFILTPRGTPLHIPTDLIYLQRKEVRRGIVTQRFLAGFQRTRRMPICPAMLTKRNMRKDLNVCLGSSRQQARSGRTNAPLYFSPAENSCSGDV